METIHLKPYESNCVSIPSTIEITVGKQTDIITYPIFGSMEDKLCYLKIIRTLQINPCIDDSVIC